MSEPLQGDSQSSATSISQLESPVPSANAESPPVAGNSAELHDYLSSIVKFFVEQLQRGLAMDQVVQWVHEQMPHLSGDLDAILPVVLKVSRCVHAFAARLWCVISDIRRRPRDSDAKYARIT